MLNTITNILVVVVIVGYIGCLIVGYIINGPSIIALSIPIGDDGGSPSVGVRALYTNGKVPVDFGEHNNRSKTQGGHIINKPYGLSSSLPGNMPTGTYTIRKMTDKIMYVESCPGNPESFSGYFDHDGHRYRWDRDGLEHWVLVDPNH